MYRSWEMDGDGFHLVSDISFIAIGFYVELLNRFT